MAIVPIRRIRRVAWVQDQRQWMFHHKLQVDLEAGVGLATGTNPAVTLSWSDDRGQTWHEEHAAQMGKLGEYRYRAIWRRLSRSRSRVYEVGTTAPVKIAWIRAFLDVEPGIS